MSRLISIFILSLVCLLPAVSRASQQPEVSSTQGYAIGSAGFDEMLGKQLGAGNLKTESMPDGSFKLTNTVQALSANITPQGVAFDSVGKSAGKGGFSIVLQQYGREGAMQAAASSSLYEKDGVVYHAHSNGIAEKFTNTGNGIRQDFIVPVRPEGEGNLQVQLSVEGAVLSSKDNGVTVSLNNSQRTLTYDRLKVIDVNNKAIPAQMQLLASNRINIVVDDSTAQYPLTIDPTVGDENWVSMGGMPGTNGRVNAVVRHGNNIYIGGSFSIAGNVQVNNIAKWDGANWSALAAGVNSSVSSLALDSSGNLYVGGYFTEAGGIAANRIAKWNGSTWTTLGTGVNSVNVPALAVDSAGNLYAGGQFTIAGGVTANYIAKWNGMAWSSLGVGTNGGISALVFDGSDNLYVGGGFTAAGGISTKNFAKWDGANWTALTGGFSGTGVNTLALDGSGNLYAGGNFGVSKWNGSQWSLLAALTGSRSTPHVQKLCFDGANNLYAGGGFNSIGGVPADGIAKWDGTNWTALDSGVGEGFVSGVISDQLNNIYVVGSFNEAGGLGANFLAKWSGSSWSVLGSGLTARVNSIVVGDTNDIYVAYEANIFGATINYVAKFNNGNWENIGRVKGHINALAVDSLGNIYAGGSFTSISNVAASGIAKWDGVSWSSLGSGINLLCYGFGCGVASIAVDKNNNLYVGGLFTSAGGNTASHIAKWDGAGWVPLGLGANDVVYALAIDSSGVLYAGGSFTSAGGSPAKLVAKWDGTNWGTLGNNADGTVYAMVVDHSDNLYIGGSFGRVAGISPISNCMAKWNGASWEAMGLGVDNCPVYSLAVDAAGTIYAGGNFANAGNNIPASHIAKWNGTVWNGLGSGVSYYNLSSRNVYALASDNENNLYVGGEFTLAGSQLSAFIAKWTIVDTDGDHWQDYEDAYPLDPTKWLDSDGDGLDDNSDNCPFIINIYQEDMDNDGIGDVCDDDTDGDGFLNGEDAFPLNPTEWLDNDGDGVGNNADSDDDDDGVPDIADAFPLDATASQDSDSDDFPDVVFPPVDDFETGNLTKFPWSSTGDALWSVSTDNKNTGNFSASSGAVEYGQQSALTLTITTGSQLSFYFFISEQNCGNSWLNFYVDGMWVGQWADYTCGAGGWTKITRSLVPGQHTLSWEYTSYDPVGNKVWIDDVIFGSALVVDNCPLLANSSQTDTDGDGAGDACDALPWDPSESVDTDGDGVGDNADATPYGTTDTDHDTLPDLWELANGRDPLKTDYMLSAGGFHSCALDNDGVKCWGNYSYGQTAVPALNNPTMVSAGYRHTCAIDTTGVKCWGAGITNAGTGDNFGQSIPPSLTNPTAVSAGYWHTCAIDGNGVQCWGKNEYGQTTVPSGLVNPVMVSAGKHHTCALDANGVQCWGANYIRQTKVPAMVGASSVSSGDTHSCAVDSTGVKCWGRNSAGQGNVPGLISPQQSATGMQHSCAVDNGGVVCWGDNAFGQTTVPALINPAALDAGLYHSCALDGAGVKCWGRNNVGQVTVPVLNFTKP